MPAQWPALPFPDWRDTCDTLHAHTQVLGKLAATLAAPEPQLQHAALRLSARGWETLPLPAPDGSGAFVVALDLHTHEALAEHSDGRVSRVALGPDRPVGEVTRELLADIGSLVGRVEIDPTPQEVSWSVPLDEDDEHRSYDAQKVERYFAAATQAALALAAFRAPYRARSTPVNAWWGSFDLAVSLFSGAAADPPSEDFIMRNAMDSQEVAVGWWPRGTRSTARRPSTPIRRLTGSAALGSRRPPRTGRRVWASTCPTGTIVVMSSDPHRFALEFARSAFQHACTVCGWGSGAARERRWNTAARQMRLAERVEAGQGGGMESGPVPPGGGRTFEGIAGAGIHSRGDP